MILLTLIIRSFQRSNYYGRLFSVDTSLGIYRKSFAGTTRCVFHWVFGQLHDLIRHLT